MLGYERTEVTSEPIVPLSTTLGPVHIAVTSAELGLFVWRDIAGLELIKGEGDALHLGVGGRPLVVLIPGARRKVQPGTTGLYHVAIHVGARADLARFLVRAMRAGLQFAPTDHLLSEVIYAWDTDGNGMELTVETPWRGKWHPVDAHHRFLTSDGRPHTGKEPVDLENLLGELAPGDDTGQRLSPKSRIGHVNLFVTDVDTAMGFYRDTIGFGGLRINRPRGNGDVGLDYVPHTVAFNSWNGRDARPAPSDAAGLRRLTINIPGETAFEALAGRLARDGFPIAGGDGWLDTADPFSNPIRIVLAADSGV